MNIARYYQQQIRETRKILTFEWTRSRTVMLIHEIRIGVASSNYSTWIREYVSIIKINLRKLDEKKKAKSIDLILFDYEMCRDFMDTKISIASRIH